MGFRGNTFKILLGNGGLNHNNNPDMIPPDALIHPSRNLNLIRSGSEKRGGTDRDLSYGAATETVVANGDCAADSDWTEGANVDWNAGEYYDFTPSGTGADNILSQDVLTAGKWYLVTFTVSNTVGDIEFCVNCGLHGFDVAADPTRGRGAHVSGDATYTEAIFAHADNTDPTEFHIVSNSAAGTGTGSVDDIIVAEMPQILGVFDYTKESGTQKIIAVGKDGNVYGDATTVIKSGWDTDERYPCFEVMQDKVYIVNGYDSPGEWDGTTWYDLDTGVEPTDWGGNNNPSWVIKHGRGEAERLFFGGCAANPGRIYVSNNFDGRILQADISGSADGALLEIDTGDGFGIIGAAIYGDRLFCFGKKRVWILDDSEADQNDWGFSGAQWYGGAASHRLICRTPNDMVAMEETGEIYSVLAAEQYGDYVAASLTRPAFINEWINEFIDLTRIDKFHMQYDPSIRAIKVFMVKQGETNVSLALCFFIDRQPQGGWIPHENSSFDSGYKACCSCVVREEAGVFKIYTGDYLGNVWSLESENSNDDGKNFYGGFMTPKLDLGDARSRKKFVRTWIEIESSDLFDFKVRTWVDGVGLGQKTFGVEGASGATFPITLDTDVLGGTERTEGIIEVKSIGKKIQLEAYSDGSGENFFASRVLIDYVLAKARAISSDASVSE